MSGRGNELQGGVGFTGIWEREKGFEVGSISKGSRRNVKDVIGKS